MFKLQILKGLDSQGLDSIYLLYLKIALFNQFVGKKRTHAQR